MTNQEILDNAPAFSTHYAKGCYFKEKDNQYLYWCPEYERWEDCLLNTFYNIRSLSDIRKIVELKHHINGMIEAEENYGCGFYNDSEWNKHYDALAEIVGNGRGDV